ncbi:MAG TPA: hypothetical protein VFI24_06815 [Pyrinomonadaceae bacterium]|nr:hypothetical protein [Pyrinomonadaceae bacterium]
MSTNATLIRIETLIALALSERWPRADGEDPESSDLSRMLAELSASDRKIALDLTQRFESLSAAARIRWLDSRLGRIRASSPERDRRCKEDIHTSEIIDALRNEPRLVQSLIVGTLVPDQQTAVAEELGVSIEPGPTGNTTIVDVVRRAFFAQFVPTSGLNDQTALDLLSGIELARLIRLLGVRETAIACKGITAVEAVTAFLKRFSAEDAHAIRFHLGSLQTVEQERIDFAEAVVSSAIEAGSIGASTLDRVGLTLLAMVLAESDELHRRHTAQKLPLAASRQLDEILKTGLPDYDFELVRNLIAEVHSLAGGLHHRPVEANDDRRIASLI